MIDNINEVKEYCKDNEIEYLINVNLKPLTTFKIGGKTDLVVYPKNNSQLTLLINEIERLSIKYFVIGNGSNLLIHDEGYSGIVIDLKKYFRNFNVNEDMLYCQSGVKLFELHKKLIEKNLSNLEFSYGIPATIGGLVSMNGGAFGQEIKDYVKSVTILENGKVKKLNASKINFEYRNSNIKGVILDCELKINYSANSVKELCYKNLEYRRLTQPYGEFCAGSIFKRNKDFIVSKEIDKLGLKGYTIGGACISSKHAGFIVNKNNATFNDVMNLIDFIKNEIYIHHKVVIEEEIIII